MCRDPPAEGMIRQVRRNSLSSGKGRAICTAAGYLVRSLEALQNFPSCHKDPDPNYAKHYLTWMPKEAW